MLGRRPERKGFQVCIATCGGPGVRAARKMIIRPGVGALDTKLDHILIRDHLRVREWDTLYLIDVE